MLAKKKVSDMKRDLPYKPSVGLTNRYRCSHNAAELPIDQRADDDYSMCFDSDRLSEDMEILGHPRAELYVSCTAPAANWIVRLCDVAPDGTSTLVTKGVLNGTHRVSHIDPTPLVPGEDIQTRYKTEGYFLGLSARDIASVLPSPTQIFPTCGRHPYAMTTSLHVDGEHESRFILPGLSAGKATGAEFSAAGNSCRHGSAAAAVTNGS